MHGCKVRRTFNFHHEIVAPVRSNDTYLDAIGQRRIDDSITL